MIGTSAMFSQKIAESSRQFRARLLYEGAAVSGEIRNITINKGACGESFSIGSIYSSYIEVTLDKCEEILENKELLLQIGLVIDDTVEYIDMGYYTVTKPSRSAYQTTFTAVGRITSKLNCLPTLPTEQTLANLAAAITEATGIQIICKGVTLAGTIEEDLTGLTCRELLEVITAVLGGFATEDNAGNIVISKFSTADQVAFNGERTITDPEFSDYDYELTGVKVIKTEEWEDEDGAVHPEVSFTEGTPRQTLSMKYMTESLFSAFKANVVGYTYRPGTIPLALGDPRLDPWDCILYTDAKGSAYVVPCLSIVHTFDGGLSTVIIAPGESESEAESQVKGPLVQQLERIAYQIFTAEQAILRRITADEADIKYAAIGSLEAANAKITSLTGEFSSFKTGEFEDLKSKAITTETLESKVGEFGYVKATELNADYARIDQTNINQAWVEDLLVKGNFLADDFNATTGSFSKWLTGVKIYGDLVETETLKADRLIIKGEDGIYRRLNIDALGEAVVNSDSKYNEQLDGSVLVKESITADHINVTDLFAKAIKSTGGFSLGGDALVYDAETDTVKFSASSVHFETGSNLEDMSIGGRNLLQRKWVVRSNAENCTIDNSEYTNSGKIIFSREAVTDKGFRVTKYEAMEPDTDYIVTFKAKVLSGSIEQIFIHNFSPNNTLSGSGQVMVDGIKLGAFSETHTIDMSDGEYHSFELRFKSTPTITSGGNPGHAVQFQKSIASAFSVEVIELKWEKGNKATDWTPAPEDVESSILAAAQTATNYINASSSGLVIGDMTAEILGKNSLIGSEGYYIRDGEEVLASFEADNISIGSNSTFARINLCAGLATLMGFQDFESGYNGFAIRTNRLYMASKLPGESGASYSPSISMYDTENGSVINLITPDASTGAEMWLQMRGSGAYFSGGSIYLDNRRYLYGDSAEGDPSLNLIGVNSSNAILVGYGSYSNDIGSTALYGNTLHFYSNYRIQAHRGIQFDNGYGISSLSSVGENHALLYLTGENVLSIGFGGYEGEVGRTTVVGNELYLGTKGVIRFRRNGSTIMSITQSNDGYDVFAPASAKQGVLGYVDQPWYTVNADILRSYDTSTTSNGVAARIYSNRIYRYSSSSRRYKEQIEAITAEEINPEKLYDIEVVQFKYQNGYLIDEDIRCNKLIPGFIVEDMAKVYPIAIDYNDDGTPEMWNANIMIPPMLRLIQEQHEVDISHEGRIARVEAQIETLQEQLSYAMITIAKQEKEINTLRQAS